MNNHIVEDPLIDDSREQWLRDNAHLFLQIQNFIDSEVIGKSITYEFVKELMDYLDYLYSGKGNVSRMFEVCKAFYRPEKEDRSLTTY